MKQWLKLPSPGVALGFVALMVAMTGGAYAGSRDALKVPADSVGPKKLKDNAVGTNKLRDNAVKGDKVDESTLGEVPSAATAGEVGYTKPFYIKLPGFDTQQVIAKNGPIQLVALCTQQPDTDAEAQIVAETNDSHTTMNGNATYTGAGPTPYLPTDAPVAIREMFDQDSDGGGPDATFVANDIDDGFLTAGDGVGQTISIDGETLMIGVNYVGGKCVFAGMVSVYNGS